MDIKPGGESMTSEIADVHLQKEGNEVERTVAQRNVVLTQPSKRGTGDWCQYTTADEIAILKGNPAHVEDVQQGTTEGSRVTIYRRENRAVADDSRGEQAPGRVRSKDDAGRPTAFFLARRLTEHAGGARIYLKREDLLHTGAHKINNTLGQILLARRMGKARIIAETGAGQHGVATATVCALFGLQCVVYMGAEDMRRHALNVFRMQLLGAEVREVDSGSQTLKDAINEALRDWVTNVADTYYLVGSSLCPHPYPLMVRDFQRVIGREARAQILEKESRLPDCLIA